MATKTETPTFDVIAGEVADQLRSTYRYQVAHRRWLFRGEEHHTWEIVNEPAKQVWDAMTAAKDRGFVPSQSEAVNILHYLKTLLETSEL